MKVGVLFCSYSQPEYLIESLAPWMDAREGKLFNNSYLVAAVSVPFKEYKDLLTPLDDITPNKLRVLKENNQIDELIDRPVYISEIDARQKALKYLLGNQCDIIISWDGDEFIKLSEMERIFNFVNVNKFISWFNLSYKNYVFNDHTYLEEPFTPPRIYKVKTNGYTLDSYIYDNNVAYKNDLNGRIIDHRDLPSVIIPSTVAFLRHYSWLNNEGSKNKILYQMKRWNTCSYQWNYEKNCLEFNEKYYHNIGQSLPKVIEEVSALHSISA
jgi:hypothetical protein